MRKVRNQVKPTEDNSGLKLLEGFDIITTDNALNIANVKKFNFM